jgi:anti-anti-sigma factor
MTTFEILETADGQLGIVGDIDLATAPALADALARCGPSVDLDLGHCTFLDSSGVSVLVEARAHAVPGLKIVNASPPVRRVLALCGLDRLFLVDHASAKLL